MFEAAAAEAPPAMVAKESSKDIEFHMETH